MAPRRKSSAHVWTAPAVRTLKTVMMICTVGLTVSMMCASYGLDLSPDFF